MNWLIENFATIIICVILIGIVGMIIRSMIRNKKQGKSSCGCGCTSCGMNEQCHKKS